MYWVLPLIVVLLFAILRILFRSAPTRLSGSFLISITGLELLILIAGEVVYHATISLAIFIATIVLLTFLLLVSRGVIYIFRIDKIALSRTVEDSLRMLLIVFEPTKQGYRLTGGDGVGVDMDCYVSRGIGILKLPKRPQWKKARLLQKLLSKKFDGIMPHITFHSS